jgi:hypothetical protein
MGNANFIPHNGPLISKIVQQLRGMSYSSMLTSSLHVRLCSSLLLVIDVSGHGVSRALLLPPTRLLHHDFPKSFTKHPLLRSFKATSKLMVHLPLLYQRSSGSAHALLPFPGHAGSDWTCCVQTRTLNSPISLDRGLVHLFVHL